MNKSDATLSSSDRLAPKAFHPSTMRQTRTSLRKCFVAFLEKDFYLSRSSKYEHSRCLPVPIIHRPKEAEWCPATLHSSP